MFGIPNKPAKSGKLLAILTTLKSIFRGRTSTLHLVVVAYLILITVFCMKSDGTFNEWNLCLHDSIHPVVEDIIVDPTIEAFEAVTED